MNQLVKIFFLKHTKDPDTDLHYKEITIAEFLISTIPTSNGLHNSIVDPTFYLRILAEFVSKHKQKPEWKCKSTEEAVYSVLIV